ncbi:hypothetical protein [Afifella sp. IM 167]|uniref:hypothetical protein n=1 Tax=Afifella sp. IM 167 TaxID=2033586 RepID=UPI001CCB5AF9|nr:hypothetical protein [Afifella sp. IM 167]MBZ8135329.1 hypothetical protein [Afifella sp. IM 167]
MKSGKIVAAALLAGTAFLAGCQTGGGGREIASPVEGRWASSDGVFVSTFRRGSMTTADAQTGAQLANGSYQMTGPSTVEISWYSIATNQQRAATCTLVTPSSMSCSQPGASFTLNRVG